MLFSGTFNTSSLGYDHMCDKDKVKMRKREEEILEKLNITR